MGNHKNFPLDHEVRAIKDINGGADYIYGVVAGAIGVVIDHFDGGRVQARFGEHAYTFRYPRQSIEKINENKYLAEQERMREFEERYARIVAEIIAEEKAVND